MPIETPTEVRRGGRGIRWVFDLGDVELEWVFTDDRRLAVRDSIERCLALGQGVCHRAGDVIVDVAVREACVEVAVRLHGTKPEMIRAMCLQWSLYLLRGLRAHRPCGEERVG